MANNKLTFTIISADTDLNRVNIVRLLVKYAVAFERLTDFPTLPDVFSVFEDYWVGDDTVCLEHALGVGCDLNLYVQEYNDKPNAIRYALYPMKPCGTVADVTNPVSTGYVSFGIVEGEPDDFFE